MSGQEVHTGVKLGEGKKNEKQERERNSKGREVGETVAVSPEK